MKIRALSRIAAEEIKSRKDAPSWLSLLLDPINQFLENITKALQNNLTFADNFAGTQSTVRIQHNTEIMVTPQTAKRVITCMVLEAEGQAIDSFGWRRDNSGNIGITIKYVGGSSSSVYSVSLLFLTV